MIAKMVIPNLPTEESVLESNTKRIKESIPTNGLKKNRYLQCLNAKVFQNFSLKDPHMSQELCKQEGLSFNGKMEKEVENSNTQNEQVNGISAIIGNPATSLWSCIPELLVDSGAIDSNDLAFNDSI